MNTIRVHVRRDIPLQCLTSDPVMRVYFGQRHNWFIEEKGWEPEGAYAGVEIDEHDGPDTMYVVAMKGSEFILGWRILPKLTYVEKSRDQYFDAEEFRAEYETSRMTTNRDITHTQKELRRSMMMLLQETYDICDCTVLTAFINERAERWLSSILRKSALSIDVHSESVYYPPHSKNPTLFRVITLHKPKELQLVN